MHLRGFTEEMSRLGMKPTSCLLEQITVHPNEEIIRSLNLQPEDRLMRLRRLGLANGIPMAIEESQIPLRQFPGLADVNFAKNSLYRVLRERYGVRVGYSDEVIEALQATREEAELLTIPNNASILSITRIIMTNQESPIE
jgi:GntR family transcriptional regulator